MDAMELYALATQMAEDLRDEQGQRARAADLFPLLEYLWERGVDLAPAHSGRRVPLLAEARSAI
jgi:hypothetical protein